MIICGDFNLPQISWIPNTAQYQTLGTVDQLRDPGTRKIQKNLGVWQKNCA